MNTCKHRFIYAYQIPIRTCLNCGLTERKIRVPRKPNGRVHEWVNND